MSGMVDLSIVIAVQHAQHNLAKILEHIDAEHNPDVEFIFCYTDIDPDTKEIVSVSDNVCVVHCSQGSLIPHLWRDGILRAGADKVAITTAHCIPEPSWVRSLLDADMESFVGVGGVIDNAPASDGVGTAIYILRYIAYASPQNARVIEDIAADNAVYRVDDIMRHRVLLQSGFWEPSFHVLFSAEGLQLRIEPLLRVVHSNCYSPAQFFSQRFAHGREFGLERARALPVQKRILLICLSPILPIVFLLKILVRVKNKQESKLCTLQSLPWLLFFLMGWGLGEARGYVASLLRDT